MPGRVETELAQSFTAFGPFLRYLRRRAHLTQRDLGLAVGYSIAQISLLENGQRLPDVTAVAALFAPALDLNDEPELVARLLELAAQARGEQPRVMITRTIRREVRASEIVETTDTPLSRSRPAPDLPAPLLPIVGRQHEIDAIRSIVLDPGIRLLTLIGPPGVGKTRLALQLAWETDAAFADGARFVELAAVRDPALVATTLLQALGLVETEGGADAFTARVNAHVRDRATLLVLDNFEHLTPAAPLITDLLSAAPRLKILITSRAALRLYGEHVFPVLPLALPDLAHLPPLDELAQLPSVALLVARARAAQPDFALAPSNALAVAAICVKLDGLPLAIELAAAQISLFPPRDLAARLVNRLSTLTRGARNRPARHQTLRGAIDWSYTLLDPDEQTLFARLGALAGGFTREAAEAIAQPGSLIADPSALFEKSLLQRRERDDEIRFYMLDSIREFALERLAASGEAAATRRRHAEFFLSFAQHAEPHLISAEQQTWLERLERERENFREALAWALESNADRDVTSALSRRELALRLCVALWRFWRYRCYLSEGYDWTARALQADRRSAHPAPLAVRAQALWGLGLFSALRREEAEAQAQLEESLRLWQSAEDKSGMASALTALGMLAGDRGDVEQAIVLQQQALALYESSNDAHGVTYARNALGESTRSQGDYVASREHYAASLAISRQIDHSRGVAIALANIAQIEIAQGDLAAARRDFAEGLTLFLKIGDSINVASCLIGLACVIGAESTPSRLSEAARLFGFAYRLLDESGGKLQTADRLEFDRHLAACRDALGDSSFETIAAEGRALTQEQAIECALNL